MHAGHTPIVIHVYYNSILIAPKLYTTRNGTFIPT
jgi:hypothetical protein